MTTTQTISTLKKIPSYLAPSLTQIQTVVEFNPTKADHRKAYAEFKQTGKWNIRFTTKWPSSVIQTVEAKLAQHACRKEWTSN